MLGECAGKSASLELPSPVGAVAGRGDLRAAFLFGSGRVPLAWEEGDVEKETSGFGFLEEAEGSELAATEDSGVGGVGTLLIGVSVTEDPSLL